MSASSRRVAICYVGANQEWADWLEELLRRRSHNVVQVRWAQSGGERLARAVDRVVANRPDVAVFLLSRHYRPPRPEDPGTTEIEAWERLGPGGPLGDRVIRVVIDREPLPEPLRDLPLLDLSRLESKAVDELLATVRVGIRP